MKEHGHDKKTNEGGSEKRDTKFDRPGAISGVNGKSDFGSAKDQKRSR